MSAPKKRKMNFSDGEIRKLIELYSQHKDVLTAKQSNSVTNKRKILIWGEITEAVNDSSDCLRSVKDIKKKWKDLLTKARKDASDKKKKPTGGGPPPKPSIYSDIIIDIFGEDCPAFTGLDGVESGDICGDGEGELSVSCANESVEEDCEGV